MTRLLPLFALALAAAPLTPLDEAAYQKAVAAHKGKVVLVNFWATYCVPCRKEMPELVALAARLKARGFELITISNDEPEQLKDAQAFAEKVKLPAPAYIRKVKDEDAFVRFIDPKWSGALPATVLFDRGGKKVKFYTGELDLKLLAADIARLLP